MRIGDVAGSVGRGLAAGAVGTAAITATMTLEQKLRGEPESTMAADAAEEVLGVEPVGPEEKVRFARGVHWLYGTAWGGVRGLLESLGLRGTAATATHFAAISTAAMVMPPALGVAPPPQDQPPAQIGSSTLHHMVYAMTTGATFRALERRRERRLLQPGYAH